MSDQVAPGQEFDELVDQEWAAFGVELGDHLAALEVGDDLTIGQAGYDLPLLVVTREAVDAFEVAAPAVQATDAADPQVRRLVDWDFEMALVFMGLGDISWSRGGVPSPDEAAWLAVRACRLVYAVPSPVVLDAGPLSVPAPDEPAVEEPELDPRQPIAVSGQEELADAIERTLEIAARGGYERDGMRFSIGDAADAVSIWPDETRPAVWVVMCPVEVRPTVVAGREIQILNRGARFGRYYLDHGMLVAEAMVVADPFVPNQLADVITGLVAEAQGLAKDFAWRTHGKVQCTGGTG